ncbi:MAG: chemotaxis protein CheW [Fibrobacterota bacterium]
MDERSNELPAEVLLFSIRGTLCAMDILSVREIQRTGDITPVFGAPKDIAGIINIRGQILTMINLPERFPGSPNASTQGGKTIIVPWHGEDVGLLVDHVEDIIPLDEQNVFSVPSNLQPEFSRYCSRVYRFDDRMIPILELEDLLQQEELSK